MSKMKSARLSRKSMTCKKKKKNILTFKKKRDGYKMNKVCWISKSKNLRKSLMTQGKAFHNIHSLI